MFPLNSNDPYIQENGTRSTLGAMIDSGGGGSDIPEYDEGDAGKVLGVDAEGLLEWKELGGGMKIYYKDYEPTFNSDEVLAKFSNNTAAASSIHMATTNGYNEVTINGYTPISVVARDVYTGYSVSILLEYFISSHGTRYYLTIGISNRVIDGNAVKARVFYVKNEDLIQLT